MIVTCAACSTRYLVDPLALGAGGRMVRCARCAQTWHQTPPEDAPLRVEPAAAQDDVSTAAAASGSASGGRIQLPALREPPHQADHAAGWLLVAVALAAAVVIGVVWDRAQVVNLWPQAGKFYAAIGLPAAAPGSGLDLRIETTARSSDNGVPALVVEGVVANVSQIARPVPKLKVILRDNAEHELQSHVFPVTDERLLPGATVPFHATVDAPNEAATQVAVTFAASGG